MDIEKLIAELTDVEKIALTSGRECFNTNSVPRLGIPRITMADGPHGVRKQLGGPTGGVADSERAVAFPTAAATASSWNPENTYKMGRAMASEAIALGINVILGPGVNIKRNPLCGRNFEYFSEDPLLAAKMGAGAVRGLQEGGVSACVKHFALNNAENFRFMGNSVCDMRAAREIYLKPFEKIVKEAKPDCIMTAYNKVRGEFCSENNWLLKDVLRGEWKYDGILMTDWGGTNKRVSSLLAGVDIEMPGDSVYARRQLHDAMENAEVRAAQDRSVKRILSLAKKHSYKEAISQGLSAHHELSRMIAEDSAVLMKNDGSLPLSAKEKIAVVGDLFEKMRYQGSGSSLINSTEVISPKLAFDGMGVSYAYFRGYDAEENEKNDDLIDEAILGVGNADKILLFIGLTELIESEGGDRENMRLPKNQIKLTEALVKLNKPIVAVLFGGSPFEIPQRDKLSSILNMYLPGQAGGCATARLLFGFVSPSGKLAESWPKSYDKVPLHDKYSNTPTELYKESVFVGYRHYLKKPDDVAFPFGFGLSYASFDYSDIEVKYNRGKYEISANIKNLSAIDAAEVVELYVRAPKSSVPKPEYELRGFDKVYLSGYEEKRITITLDIDELRLYDPAACGWILEGGEYELLLGSSSTDIKLTSKIKIEGEEVKVPYEERICKILNSGNYNELSDSEFYEFCGICDTEAAPTLPITVYSRFSDLKETFFGRIIRNAVLYFLSGREIKKAKKMPDGPEKTRAIKSAVFLGKMLDTNSLIAMSYSSSGLLPYNVAEGIADIANGRLFPGLGKIMKPIKAPKLPEESL